MSVVQEFIIHHFPGYAVSHLHRSHLSVKKG